MITVEFKDFDDMVLFARRLTENTSAPNVAPMPVTAQVQENPIPVQPMTMYSPQQPAPVQTPAVPSLQQVSTPVPPVSVQQVPVSAQTYTLDDLAAAAMTLMDAGRQGELLQLLASFEVETLPSLPQAQYGAFATALRGMGAKI